MRDSLVRLLLCGDVMTGRGVDQILPHPGDPALREAYAADARDYVALAEAVNGPVPRPAGFTWPWGDALRLLEEAAPDARVLNLETSVTRSDDFAPDKGITYRMHPDNVPCLSAVRPDVCVLANNHVLDFGRSGLRETLDVLGRSGLRTAGAGRNAEEAWGPAALAVRDGRRVVVLALGMATSGIPGEWAATADRSGVAFVAQPSDEAAAEVVDRVRRVRQPGDIVIVSVHWGSNWGYHVPPEQTRFAHALIDGGVDVVHGHSSHHPRPVEVYRGKLVLYGCGDLVDDYEGISGHERYRDDLRLLYLVAVDPATGRTAGVRLVPLRSRRMRLCRASPEDTDWLREELDRVSRAFGVRVEAGPGGTLGIRTRPGGGNGEAAP